MNSKHYVVLITVVVVLFAAPLLFLPSAQFSGADSSAEQTISNQGYTPWFNPIWEPPSSEIETLLFSLQAAVGAIIIGYFIGYERGKRAQKVSNRKTKPFPTPGE